MEHGIYSLVGAYRWIVPLTIITGRGSKHDIWMLDNGAIITKIYHGLYRYDVLCDMMHQI